MYTKEIFCVLKSVLWCRAATIRGPKELDCQLFCHLGLGLLVGQNKQFEDMALATF